VSLEVENPKTFRPTTNLMNLKKSPIPQSVNPKNFLPASARHRRRAALEFRNAIYDL
jgi:hypothetical protein